MHAPLSYTTLRWFYIMMLRRNMLGRTGPKRLSKKTCLEDCAVFVHIHICDRQSALMLQCAACMKERIARAENECFSFETVPHSTAFNAVSRALRRPPSKNKRPKSPHGPTHLTEKKTARIASGFPGHPRPTGANASATNYTLVHQVGGKMLGTRLQGAYSNLTQRSPQQHPAARAAP